MELLIDGHNLIDALPGIDLADPHDEALLVGKLKAYCGRTRRKVTVIFDRGLPGGPSRDLSGGPVKVIFASQHTTADRLIMKRIQETKDRGRYLVISSDHEILAAARGRDLETMTSKDFAQKLAATMQPPTAAESDEIPDDVHLGPDEVKEWYRLFNEPPEE